MSDRLALANAIEDASIEHGKGRARRLGHLRRHAAVRRAAPLAAARVTPPLPRGVFDYLIRFARSRWSWC
jgi:hypothetical protein